MKKPPRGFRVIPRLSPFNSLVGPLYLRKPRGTPVSIGVRIEKKHMNSRGICHGGVLATLADLALGYAIHGKSGGTAAFVTAHLAVDYAGAGRERGRGASKSAIHRIWPPPGFANCAPAGARRGARRARA